MKLVIDIPKDMYEGIKQLKIQYPRGSAKANQLDFYYGLLTCLKQGVPLPKADRFDRFKFEGDEKWVKLNKDDFKAFIECNSPEVTCYKCPYNTNQPRCEYILDVSELWLHSIFNMIMNTDETSATKCFETINKIKKGDIK